MSIKHHWKRRNRVFLHIVLIVVVALLSFPHLWMFLTSIRPESELYKSPPLLVPRGLTLQNFFKAIKMADFGLFFLNSIIVAAAVVAITIFVAALGGYALSRFRYPFQGSLFRFILFSYMIPPILFSLPLFVLMSRLGLTNTRLGLILAQLTMTFPIALWILVGFFHAIPIELEESALIDGASRLQIFSRIILPLASPGISAVALFTFIASWNDYIFALIFVSLPELKTIPLGLALYVHSTAVDWGALMASCSLAAIPTMLLLLFSQRQLISGFGGALKG